MPPRSEHYTLVGFSAELDWRPVRFVDPLPQNSVCDICGLVRFSTASIPCGHTLCITCYRQCAQDGLLVCPLDDCQCQDGDVQWDNFSLERRQMHCWNAAAGCQYVAEPSRIVRHFHHECAHNFVSCPKCSGPVPCSGVVTHMKSGLCQPQLALAVHRRERQTERDSEDAILVSLIAAIGKPADQVKEFFGRITGDIQRYGDRLNSICQGLNSLRETFREVSSRLNLGTLTLREQGIAARTRGANECLSAATNTLQTLSDSISRLQQTLTDEMAPAATQSRDIPQTASDIIEATTAAEMYNREALNRLRSLQQYATLGVSQCLFFVRNFQSLQRTAMSEGSAWYESEPVYLRGYCVAPGVDFWVDNGILVLQARLRLLSSEFDDLVYWPFEHTIKLAVMHPGQGAESAFEVKTSRFLENCQRPTGMGNHAVRMNGPSLNIADLIAGGYVEDDQIRVKYQLLP